MAITTQSSNQNTNSTTPSITLPASVAAGDLLIALISSDGSRTATWPGSWVAIKDEAGTGFSFAAAYLIAAGGETSVSPTMSVTERSNHIAIRIPAAEWHGTTPPEISANASGSDANPDPPALDPSWATALTRWFAIYAADQQATPQTTSAYPTNYTDNQTDSTTATSAGNVACASREANVASENPGTFTMTVAETWNAYTLAIRLAAGSLIDRTAADALGASDSATRVWAGFRTVTDARGQSDAAVRGLILSRSATDALGLTDVATRSAVLVRTTKGGYRDSFQRLATNAWGTADVGGAWTVNGIESEFNVDGQVGMIDVSVAEFDYLGELAATAVDVDVSLRFRTDKATTDTQYVSVFARRGGGAWYRLIVRLELDDSITAQLDRSGVSLVSATTVAGLTHAANVWFRLRFQVIGTTIRARVWADGSAEPGTWVVTTTDSGVTAAGVLAIAAQMGASTSNFPVRFSFDELTSPDVDGAAFSDAAAFFKTVVRTTTDAVGRSDVATRAVTLARATADALAASDAATRVLASLRSVADASGRSDAATRVLFALRTVSDAVARADAAVRAMVLARTATDVSGRSDAATRSVTLARSVSDASGRGDVATRLVTLSRAAADALGLADVATFIKEGGALLFRTAADALGQADVATRSVNLARSVSDAVGRSDVASRVITSVRQTADSLGLSDVADAVRNVVGGFPPLAWSVRHLPSAVASRLLPRGSATSPTPTGRASNPKPEH